MADYGTVTITEEIYLPIKKLIFAWTSEDGGAHGGEVTKTTTYSYTGEIIRLCTVPSGATAPSDNYNVTLLDEDGTDVLMSGGLLRSSTLTQQVLASSLGSVGYDKLRLSISSAGNAKLGTVYVYIKEATYGPAAQDSL